MKKGTITRVIQCLFVIYCIVLFFILFLYGARMGNQFHLKVFSKEHLEMVNIIPFKTILGFFGRMQDTTINSDIAVRNILANLLMFIPMGMALPVIFGRIFHSFWKTTLFTIGLVSLIEIVQFMTFCGSADIDDLILNTLGCMIGYGIIQIRCVRNLLNLDA